MIARVTDLLGLPGIVGMLAVALVTAALPHHGFTEGSAFARAVEVTGDPVVAYVGSVAIYYSLLVAHFAVLLWVWEGFLERLDR